VHNHLLGPFISEVLKSGSSDAFLGICWFFTKIEITKVFWQQLDKAAVFHLLSQKLKVATELLSIRWGAEAFGKLAAVSYSSGFGAVVQFLLKKAQDRE
jgi:hypothetical protein